MGDCGVKTKDALDVCDVAGLYLRGLEKTKKTIGPILNSTTTQQARSLELPLLLQCKSDVSGGS